MSERKKSGIYVIKNIVSGKCYVGQAASIGDRWLTHKSHLSCGRHHSRHLQSAWKKHGPEAFVFEVLEYVPKDRDLLAAREQHWFDTLRPEYNSAPVAGSSLGLKHPPRSESFRKRMSEMKRGYRPSPETLEKLRAAYAANPYKQTPAHRAAILKANTGRKRTPEEIEKWRLKVVGTKQSPETIAKRVSKLLGHPVSEETRKKISEANKGKLKGRKLSEEHKQAIGDGNRGKKSLRVEQPWLAGKGLIML